MNLDETDHDKWSYIDLADQMRRWLLDPTPDLHELFRRIVFNGLISNTDDHPRNHGFLYMGDSYRLSPVYDLVPRPETGTTRYLAMPFGDLGRVFNLENLTSRCDAFDLSKTEAISLFEELREKISKWRSFYQTHKLDPSDMQYLENVFSHWSTL